jgi:TolB-like protein
MKKLVLAALLCGMACCAYAQRLPRLAVVAFDTNVDTPKVRQDVVTVRNQVESEMIATGKYQIITRTDIDALLENQRIQVSSISSAENLRKLQLQNINYIVTGSVNAVDSDYFITVRILDVSSGQFSHSANEFMGGSSRELISGVRTLANRFIAGMDSEEGRVVQSGASSGNSGKEYKIGDRGPAGGWVFYDKGIVSNGWRYLEAAPAGTEFRAEWGTDGKDVAGTGTAVGSGKRNTEIIVEYLRRIGESGKAAQLCDELTVGNNNAFDDWFLPSLDELNLMYQNLKQKGLGDFSDWFYWSSSKYDTYHSWAQNFSDGGQNPRHYYQGDGTRNVRAVRAF